MERCEALAARQEGRKPRALMESDYLLGVFDLYRMGGLRFKLQPDGPFLDNNDAMAAPPMTSPQLEREDAMEDPAFTQWLNLDLAREVAEMSQLSQEIRETIIEKVTKSPPSSAFPSPKSSAWNLLFQQLDHCQFWLKFSNIIRHFKQTV